MSDAIESPAEPAAQRYGAGRLALGLLGRTWLSFLAGALLVTTIPLLFGWRPYVVQSDSMAPAIRAGDVVLSSPAREPDELLGRVIVFESPDRSDTVVTHRVVAIGDDGALVTKGDANQSEDSAAVTPEAVRGMGRLLVRWAGLPWMWLRDGAWLQILLLAATIAIAVVGVVRDDEDDEAAEPVSDERPAQVPVPVRPVRLPRPVPAPLRAGALPRRPREPVEAEAVPIANGDGNDAEVAAPAAAGSLPRNPARPPSSRPQLDDGADGPSTLPRSGRARSAPGDPDVAVQVPADTSDDRHDDRHDDPVDDSDEHPDRDGGLRVTPTAGAGRGGGRRLRRGRRLGDLRVVTMLLAGLGALGVPSVAAAAFSASTASTASSWSVPNLDYPSEILARSPYLYWRLDETGGNRAADSSGNGREGRYRRNGGNGSFTRLADGALLTDTPDRAVQLVAADSCITTDSNTAITGPQVFTVIAWFRAPVTNTNGGKLLGFERPQDGVDAPSAGTYDRQLYLDGSGRVWFAVYNGGHVALSSTPGLNDDAWHLAVGTQSAAGMRLYVDGALVASNANTVAEGSTGWWRAGCGNLSGWGGQWTGPNNPGTNSAVTQNRPFLGSLDEITVYDGRALTDAEVATLFFAR